jgi:hypothetical protein
MRKSKKASSRKAVVRAARRTSQITEAQCAPLAAMLKKPLSASEVCDIFRNFQNAIFNDREVDKTDHKSLRKAWNDVGLKSLQLRKLLLDAGNAGSPGMRKLRFVHEFLESRDDLLDSLESMGTWAGTYLDFLEKLANDRRGGRSRSGEFTYALLLNLWIMRGGRPSVSAVGPFEKFLVGASMVILGAAPDQKTIPGIVTRAKKTLSKLSDLKLENAF